ncbi:MAG: sigma-54-dependent transcriptional regulator [Chitinispirillaceae bacterium]
MSAEFTNIKTILVVDDEDAMREFMCEALFNEQWDVIAAHSCGEALKKIENKSCDVLITDIRFEKESGIELAKAVSRKYARAAIIIVTGYPEVDHIKYADQLDANFLTKPFTARQLRFSVLAALEKVSNHPQQDEFITDKDNLGIIGNSPYTIRLREEIRRLGPGEFPVLISGPSGTGKELVANAIHRCGSRRARPMITINCAAIPRHLEEAEFFGYTRGAFTGAEIAKHGIIASAQSSTLFLDEVGELSLDMQAKLLRVLDTGEYRRIGENHTRKADIRIVSATNRNLEDMISDGTFRQDLYFRLKGAVMETVPLCKRKEDIPTLVKAFIAENTGEEKVLGITADAVSFLVNQQWEGNVRELKHAVTMLCHFAGGMRRINMSVIQEALDISENTSEEHMPYMKAKEELLRRFENEFFTRLVQRHNGNLNRAAKSTGMHRPNLIKKLRALNIDPDNFRQ